MSKHGRLIDADALCERMYHDAFETDSNMQKWDSGCWIRYKMFENAISDAPTVEPEPCEDTSCPYCHEDSDGYVAPLEKNCHAFIHFGMDGWCLNLRANKWHGEVKINYCPMCGRKF